MHWPNVKEKLAITHVVLDLDVVQLACSGITSWNIA